jgi:hypothetical protein
MPAVHKGRAMNNEPSNLQLVLMALVTAGVLYALLWLAMII